MNRVPLGVTRPDRVVGLLTFFVSAETTAGAIGHNPPPVSILDCSVRQPEFMTEREMAS